MLQIAVETTVEIREFLEVCFWGRSEVGGADTTAAIQFGFDRGAQRTRARAPAGNVPRIARTLGFQAGRIRCRMTPRPSPAEALRDLALVARCPSSILLELWARFHCSTFRLVPSLAFADHTKLFVIQPMPCGFVLQPVPSGVVVPRSRPALWLTQFEFPHRIL